MIKKILKFLLLGFIAIILLLGLLTVLANIVNKYFDKPKKEEAGPPVATMEYLKPTKEHHVGSIIRYTYRYGTLTIDRDFSGSRNLKPHRLFAEIYTSWPEFGKREQYLKSDEDKRLRIMFEINKYKAAIFRDIYNQVSDDLNPYGIEDNRFPGFVGYKRRNGWLYVAKSSDLVMPQGTPVAILCSDDKFHDTPSGRKVGRCRYAFVFDEDLRAQVRFNKPLMREFAQVHKDLAKFMGSMVESRQ